MLHELIGNLAVVALAVVGWAQLGRQLEGRPIAQQNAVFSLFMGAGAVVSMVLSVPLQDGVIFDLRAALIAISGFFGGPLAAICSGAIAGTYRVWVGGAGMPAGLILIVTATLAGAIAHILAKRHPGAVWQVLGLSLGATLATLLGFVALPASLSAEALQRFAPTVLGFTFAATFISGLNILQWRRLSDERRLLQAALFQSPDFQYIKNRQSQFVTVNQHVAEHNGFADPAAMRGKTDFDLFTPDHARELFVAEQHIMHSGETIVDLEECLADKSGNNRWYSTSKSPVVGVDGTVIGLAGVTREITERKKIEAELLKNRNLLSYALAGMLDGLAMYDTKGFLIFCNEQYRAIFPLTANVRVPGVHFRDILRAIVATGEQPDIPSERTDAWIESTAATLHTAGEREVKLVDGRWVKIRTRPMDDGVSIVTVADITQARLSQDSLLMLTTQLRSLAETDGLTGLANRRAFDEALDDELLRTSRAREPLSLLMIDVDHFKSYNDLYGHLAGDDCLRAIGKCLRQVSRRPREIVARFGGEEFVLALPGTDENGARFVAKRLRDLLADLAVPHLGNEPPVVTVSIGIATYSARVPERTPAEILHRADEALYEAKEAGRNRVVTWNGMREGKSSSAA